MMQRRPDTYTSVNTNTQRTGLPVQAHKMVFLTGDDFKDAVTTPVEVYDSAVADELINSTDGTDSIASRMVAAALQVSQGVNMSVGGLAASAGVSYIKSVEGGVIVTPVAV